MIYIDELLVMGTHALLILSLIIKLKTRFSSKDLGSLGYFLGIQATRDAHGLHLSQNKYILGILHHARMVKEKSYSAPFVSSES